MTDWKRPESALRVLSHPEEVYQVKVHDKAAVSAKGVHEIEQPCIRCFIRLDGSKQFCYLASDGVSKAHHGVDGKHAAEPCHLALRVRLERYNTEVNESLAIAGTANSLLNSGRQSTC
jgi:hypothetical protein